MLCVLLQTQHTHCCLLLKARCTAECYCARAVYMQCDLTRRSEWLYGHRARMYGQGAVLFSCDTSVVLDSYLILVRVATTYSIGSVGGLAYGVRSAISQRSR